MRKISFWLSLCLIFSIPWENAVTIEGIGTLTRAFGIAAFISWSISIIIDRYMRSLHVFHFISALFICWNILSFYWSMGSEQSVRQIVTLIQLAAMAWMFLDLFCSYEKIRMALEAYILGAYITIFCLIANFVKGETIAIYEEGRFTGAGINAVELTIILSIALVCSWYLATSSSGNEIHVKILKIINYCFCPMSIFSILITGSRTGVFALVPAILYIGISAGKLRIVYKVAMVVCATGVILLVISIIPDYTAKRLLSIGESVGEFDFGGRGKLWNTIIDFFLSHPFLGIGCGSLSAEGVLGDVAHNTFLSILTELGTIGLFIFIAMLLVVWRQAAIGLRQHMNVWLFLLAVWAMGSLSLSWELTKTTWLVMAIIIASGRLVNTTEDSEAIEPSDVSR